MHDGFQADDIYMMVEDEFQTVAQSYTAHLHQAEYKRLMREARNKPSKPLPEPASPMSKTAKNRLKSVILQKKQKDALRQVMGTDLQDQQDADDVVDLWSGTSLAQFMSGNSQGKTSLIGLERISSTTKAGSGFARTDANQSRLQHEPRKQSTTSSALSVTHRLKHDQDSSHPHPSSSLSVPAQPGASTSRSHRTNSKDTTKTSLYLSNGEDDLFINRQQSTDESIRGGPSRLSTRLNRGDGRKAQNGRSSIQEKEADRKARLAQVPMFMI
ncbi:hypothetical protein, variant [Exophiala mesophila]|nr:hypothetical protein, variant [Exophiala mesophila]KIV92456.1 hypothetical protein, variant [Exophiala mesophila]